MFSNAPVLLNQVAKRIVNVVKIGSFVIADVIQVLLPITNDSYDIKWLLYELAPVLQVTYCKRIYLASTGQLKFILTIAFWSD